MDYYKYQQLESVFEDLVKDDMSLQEALNIARKHNPEAGNKLARHIYTSQMVPKAGNKFAYNDFLKRHDNSGTHLSIDLNSNAYLNKRYGYEAGDKGIKDSFNTLADISRKHGGKFFHISGDEARAHFPTPERALAFSKAAQAALANNPKIHGEFQPSASIGIGHTPEHAEQALIRAKDQLGPLVGGKRQKINAPGMEPTVYHSLLHEAPPANWKPEKEHPNITPLPHEAPVSNGLSMKNPLK